MAKVRGISQQDTEFREDLKNLDVETLIEKYGLKRGRGGSVLVTKNPHGELQPNGFWEFGNQDCVEARKLTDIYKNL